MRGLDQVPEYQFVDACIAANCVANLSNWRWLEAAAEVFFRQLCSR
jgi:hypothetical protein